MTRRGALLRSLSTVLIVSGVLMLADAGLTLVWQEPVSAVYAKILPGQPRRRPAQARARQAERASTSRRCASSPPRSGGWRSSRAGCAPTLDRGAAAGRIEDRRGSRPTTSSSTAPTPASLRKGPGIYDDVPFPGAPGTTAIAGHRTTYGAPFRKINKIKRGDEIVVEMRYGTLHLRGREDADRQADGAGGHPPRELRPARAVGLPSALQRGQALSSSSPASSPRRRAARRGSDVCTARRHVATLADAMNPPLKPDDGALDSAAGMRLQELKLRVQRADYVVDPALVAAAMLRHAVSQRRCWKPRAVCATPPTAARPRAVPSRTAPIQVSAAADSRPRRSAGRDAARAARSPRPRRRRAPTPGRPSWPATVRDAVGERQRVEVDLERDAARARDVAGVGGQPVGEVDHRVRAGAGQRAALRPGAARGGGGARRAPAGPVARPSRIASPAPEAPSVPVTPTRSPARAPARRTSCAELVGPADDRDRERQHRRGR